MSHVNVQEQAETLKRLVTSNGSASVADFCALVDLMIDIYQYIEEVDSSLGDIARRVEALPDVNCVIEDVRNEIQDVQSEVVDLTREIEGLNDSLRMSDGPA